MPSELPLLVKPNAFEATVGIPLRTGYALVEQGVLEPPVR